MGQKSTTLVSVQTTSISLEVNLHQLFQFPQAITNILVSSWPFLSSHQL